jgi:hypothetical protein
VFKICALVDNYTGKGNQFKLCSTVKLFCIDCRMVLHWNQCSKRITKVRKKYEYSSNLTLKFVVIVKILHLNLLSIYGNNNAMTNVIHFSFANVAACTILFTYNRVE